MTILLADLLGGLREDHRNMGIMLDLLERDLAHIRDSEKPNYELIHDIMRYMTVYSDAVHHPKEDLLYGAMKAEDPALANGLEKVEPEHREIAILGETLRNDVEAIASGAAVTRFRLVADMSDYIERLREHMSWEEEDLFQRADDISGYFEEAVHSLANCRHVIDIRNFKIIDDINLFFGSRPTFEELLDDLAKDAPSLDRAILVCHAPPAKTALGVIGDGTDVGSVALGKWIQKHQPLLTLHGHIHESPKVTGEHTAKVGRTTAHQPGQGAGEMLAYSIVTINEDEVGIEHIQKYPYNT